MKPVLALDIVYPNKQYGGIYSLGPLIVWNMARQRPGWKCERVYLDHGRITAPLVGFSLQYELDIFNAVRMKPKTGYTFAGGPVVQANLPLVEKHFDFFILGDIEAVLDSVLDAYEVGHDVFLDRIAMLRGVYVPGKNSPSYAYVNKLDDVPYPVLQSFPSPLGKEFVFGKCFILEVERGCPYCCTFCAVPTFYEKVKFRSLDKLKEIIDDGIRLNNPDKIVIYAPSFVHPQRKELLRYLISKRIRVVVPSIKAAHVDEELLMLVREAGQESLTIAPECNERVRFLVNKKVKDEQYFQFVEACNVAGIKKLKVYLMIGLPGMTVDDVVDMAIFVKDMQRRFSGRLYLSVNYYVPKPGTPGWQHMFDRKVLKAQAKVVEKEFKSFRVKMPSLSTSAKEWELSCGLVSTEGL